MADAPNTNGNGNGILSIPVKLTPTGRWAAVIMAAVVAAGYYGYNRLSSQKVDAATAAVIKPTVRDLGNGAYLFERRGAVADSNDLFAGIVGWQNNNPNLDILAVVPCDRQGNGGDQIVVSALVVTRPKMQAAQ